jgi:hypothetical protein
VILVVDPDGGSIHPPDSGPRHSRPCQALSVVASGQSSLDFHLSLRRGTRGYRRATALSGRGRHARAVIGVDPGDGVDETHRPRGQADARPGDLPAQEPAGFIGRGTALARLLGLVDPVPPAGQVLVVTGEAGMGKTVLLADAAGRARSAGTRVLSITGRESESKLAFAGLHQLLRPVLSSAAGLPGRQAQALQGALGLAPDSIAPDPLLARVAVPTLLSSALLFRAAMSMSSTRRQVSGSADRNEVRGGRTVPADAPHRPGRAIRPGWGAVFRPVSPGIVHGRGHWRT